MWAVFAIIHEETDKYEKLAHDLYNVTNFNAYKISFGFFLHTLICNSSRILILYHFTTYSLCFGYGVRFLIIISIVFMQKKFEPNFDPVINISYIASLIKLQNNCNHAMPVKQDRMVLLLKRNREVSSLVQNVVSFRAVIFFSTVNTYINDFGDHSIMIL